MLLSYYAYILYLLRFSLETVKARNVSRINLNILFQ